MSEAPLVVLDANVLYPATLRDLFLWLSFRKVIRAHWSDGIHEEWMRNVENDLGIPKKKLTALRALMDAHSDDALIGNSKRYEVRFPNCDEKDRHVAAAALKVSIDNARKPVSIITFNTKDFDGKELAVNGLGMMKPDNFLRRLVVAERSSVIASIKAQRENYRNPSMPPARMLELFRRQRLPRFVAQLLPHLGEI